MVTVCFTTVAVINGDTSVRHATRREAITLAARTLFDALSSVVFLFALSSMPQANCLAIMQALPLIVTAVSGALGDRIEWISWLFVGIGFVGVLCIVRPGAVGFSLHSLVALAAVCLMTVRPGWARGS